MRQSCQEMSRSKKIIHKYISSKQRNSVELLINREKSIYRWFKNAFDLTFDLFLINGH